MTIVIRIHAQGILNICTTFHDELSNSCQDIIIKTKIVNLTAALDKKLEDHQTHQDSSSRDHNVL